MGVDFHLQAVRPTVSGGIEEVSGDEARYSQRLFVLEDLFRPKEDGPGIAERVHGWMSRSISLQWFEDAYNHMGVEVGRPPDAGNTWPPKEIVDALEAIGDILREHTVELPPYYRFHEPGGRGAGGYRMVVGDRRYLVRGGWGRCIATLVDERGNPIREEGQELDLSGEREIRVHAIFIPFDLRRLGEDVVGPEIRVGIARETCEEHFRPDLEAMVRVCRVAERPGHRLFTSVD